jgi:hypothetical protein
LDTNKDCNYKGLGGSIPCIDRVLYFMARARGQRTSTF